MGVNATQFFSSFSENSSALNLTPFIRSSQIGNAVAAKVEQSADRTTKMARSKGIQSDKDTQRVISTTTTVVSPFVAIAAAGYMAAANNGINTQINEKIVKGDFLKRFGAEAEKLNIKLDSERSISNAYGLERYNFGKKYDNVERGLGGLETKYVGINKIYQVGQGGATTNAVGNLLEQSVKQKAVEKLKSSFVFTSGNGAFKVESINNNELGVRVGYRNHAISNSSYEAVIRSDFLKDVSKLSNSGKLTDPNVQINELIKKHLENGTLFEKDINLVTHNMEREASNAIELLNVMGMAEFAAKNHSIDKDFVKQFLMVRNHYKNAAFTQKMYDRLAKPTRFVRMGYRIITMPLQQSETMKGFNLASSVARGAGTVKAVVFNPALNLSTNAVLRFRQLRELMTIKKYLDTVGTGSSLQAIINFRNSKAMMETMYKWSGRKAITMQRMPILGRQTYITILKNRMLKEFLQRHSERLLAQEGNMFAQAVGASFRNALVSKQGNSLSGAVLKELNKTILKGVFDATKNKVASTAVGQVAKKAGGKLANTLVGRATRTAGHAVGTAFKFLGGIGKSIMAGLQAFAAAVAVVVGYIATALLAIVAIFASILILINIADMVMSQFEDISNYVDRFTMSSAKDYERRAKIVMKEIKTCHQEQLDELKSIQTSYDTADIEYPSGEQENYKEIWSAINVMTQYDPTILTTTEIKDIADTLYEQTHRVTTDEYTFYYDNGSQGRACHIFLDIQRGDALTAEVLADSFMSVGDAQATAGGIRAVATNVVNDDWLNVVRNIKAAIAQTGTGYSQTTTVPITVNGNSMRVRPDCSGYTKACLGVYGMIPIDQNWTSYDFVSAGSLNGFTRYSWSGWQNLNEGDIIACNGHVEIFAYNEGSNHYVYNCGSTSSVRSATPTRSGHKSYAVVWRPNAPGSVTTISNNTLGGEEGTDSAMENGDDNSEEGVTYAPVFSNTLNIVWNEDTENEDGYEDTLIADIEAEKASGKIFNNANYREPNTSHTLTKTSNGASSWDFIRYIYAKHGVPVGFDHSDGFSAEIPYVESVLRPGDVIYYAQHTPTFDLIGDELAKKNKTFTDMPLHYAPKNSVLNLSAEYVDEDGYCEVSDYIIDNMIPLIYIGDGKAVGYDKNVTIVPYPEITGNADIHEYKLSQLDEDRVYRVDRPTGFTVQPIYGHTSYFEGWTDWNIACFLELINDEIWTTGEKNLEEYAVVDDETGEAIPSIRYDWYEEEYFSGNDVYYSQSHTDAFKADMLKMLTAFFDEYGVLPSVGYTSAHALSNNRSTGESLTYYNVWEQLAENSAAASDAEDKYSYEANGDATVTVREYKMYGSYLEAYIDWYNMLRKTGAMPNDPKFTTYAEQVNYFSVHGALNADTKAKMNSAHSVDLDQIDKIAVERKELIDDMIKLSDELATADYSNHGGAVSKGGSDRTRYYDLAQKLNDYRSDYIRLREIVESTDTSTEKVKNILNNYLKKYDIYKSRVNAMLSYRDSHEGLYIESYTCQGHESEPEWKDSGKKDQNGQPIQIQVTHTEYHNDGNPMGSDCGNATPNYEKWEPMTVYSKPLDQEVTKTYEYSR